MTVKAERSSIYVFTGLKNSAPAPGQFQKAIHKKFSHNFILLKMKKIHILKKSAGHESVSFG